MNSNWVRVLVLIVAGFKAADRKTELGGCPLLLMALFCEYSNTTQLPRWSYATPTISDWNDKSTKLLDTFVLSSPDGYMTKNICGNVKDIFQCCRTYNFY
ncbi:hypothetical protein SOVF_037880 [Spinacia oleracea]|nr:hypothetical protein SOVF_037880 [Spinacia oleracea]